MPGVGDEQSREFEKGRELLEGREGKGGGVKRVGCCYHRQEFLAGVSSRDGGDQKWTTVNGPGGRTT